MSQTKAREWQILFVEDDEDDYILFRDTSRNMTHHKAVVTWVRDIKGCLCQSAESPFDLLVVDYHLGSLTGLDLLSSLRTAGCKAPVIFLTGPYDARNFAEAAALGMALFLQKDELTPNRLERLIQSLLIISE